MLFDLGLPFSSRYAFSMDRYTRPSGLRDCLRFKSNTSSGGMCHFHYTTYCYTLPYQNAHKNKEKKPCKHDAARFSKTVLVPILSNQRCMQGKSSAHENTSSYIKI